MNATCDGGLCGTAFAAVGTPSLTQSPGDCHKNQCDGAGNLEVAVDNSDVPDDGNSCTTDTCTNGTPGHTQAPAGTACGPGMTCSAQGTCTGCAAASDCPGTDTECQQRTCTAGTCGVVNTAAGTAVSAQTAGDCHKNQCDGMGNVATVIDNADVPVDGNACTSDVCSNGVAANPPASAGTPCSQGVCDGNGMCVGCTTAADCPSTGMPCLAATCTAGVCGTTPVAAGTPALTQTAGDCQQSVCDGVGGVTNTADDADVPVDNQSCTMDVCTNGVPSNPPVAAGTACSQGNGTLCNGSGACVQCITAADCPATGSACLSATCNAGVCGTTPVAAGTPAPAQTMGDCQQIVCNGMGGTTSVADNADVPADDGNACTSDACTNGAPTHAPVLPGTPCNQDGGAYCDGVSACTQAFVVVRVDGGSAALTSAAALVHLDAYLPVPGSPPVLTAALPTAVSGANQPLLLSGTSTTEGGLSRSADGHYIALAGYAAAVGASTTGTTRVVGRANVQGTVDTSTQLAAAAFAGSNVRGATSIDGANFWVAGNSTSSTGGGVWYVPLGASGGGTQVLAAPNNARMLNIFGGQLYGTSGSSPFTNVFAVGTGTPTAAGATATSLPGLPTSGASPLGFVLLDTNAAVAGVDTLYLAGAALQRWTSNGTTWTQDTTFTAPSGTALGVTGWVTGTGVTLIVTTASSVVRVDVPTGGAAVSTPLFTAPTNNAFRGVALAPN